MMWERRLKRRPKQAGERLSPDERAAGNTALGSGGQYWRCGSASPSQLPIPGTRVHVEIGCPRSAIRRGGKTASSSRRSWARSSGPRGGQRLFCLHTPHPSRPTSLPFTREFIHIRAKIDTRRPSVLGGGVLEPNEPWGLDRLDRLRGRSWSATHPRSGSTEPPYVTPHRRRLARRSPISRRRFTAYPGAGHAEGGMGRSQTFQASSRVALLDLRRYASLYFGLPGRAPYTLYAPNESRSGCDSNLQH